jgi:anaerobic magnesium-protoporphyrin IX monomethyl ester cyclase
MKKLALINPGRRIEFAVYEPLNLEVIASYVGQYGIDVKIIDELAGQNVMGEIMCYAPDIVGITATTPVILDAYKIADKCRDLYIRTVIGGVHASVLPEEALQHADIVVKGEGEIAMLQIMQQDIKSGIVEGTPIMNIDDISIFDRSRVETDFYLRMPETFMSCIPYNTLTGTMLTQRGCNHNCIFCHNSWRDLPYRCNSAKRVIDEIRYLVKTYHIKVVLFMDDNLFMNRPRMHQICHELIDANLPITWAAQSRVDNIDIETLKLAKQAGCRSVGFGFETGSQRILDILNKKTTVEQNINAIKICHELGISVASAFMIGSPTETVEDVRLTQEFIKNNPIETSSACVTTPFPGTQLWEWGRKQGLIPEHPDWSKFVFDRINKDILVCDTIPFPQLEALYKETVALVANEKARISPWWLANMAIRHPLKMATIASRSNTWMKYLSRVKVGG